jgi:hypothetical protein
LMEEKVKQTDVRFFRKLSSAFWSVRFLLLILFWT